MPKVFFSFRMKETHVHLNNLIDARRRKDGKKWWLGKFGFCNGILWNIFLQKDFSSFLVFVMWNVRYFLFLGILSLWTTVPSISSEGQKKQRNKTNWPSSPLLPPEAKDNYTKVDAFTRSRWWPLDNLDKEKKAHKCCKKWPAFFIIKQF